MSLFQTHGVNDMAARKKKATKKKKTAKAKTARKAAAKTSRKAAKNPARKSKKATPAKKSIKAAVKKAPAKKVKKAAKPIGEGDYAASRAFLKDQSGFVEKNKANIAAMGKDAEKALEGPEGAELRDAEATAAARSRDIF